jgi:HSP20 family protein
MSYWNYNPYYNLSELQKQMQRLWQEQEKSASASEAKPTWAPVIDIYETESELVLQGELPGMQESDFKLNVDNNLLTLSGERQFSNYQDVEIHRRERPAGHFQRRFSLPTNVDLKNVAAKYEQGILTITVPKKVEARSRQIPITVK